MSFTVLPFESISYDLGRHATGSEPTFSIIKSTGLFGGASYGDVHTFIDHGGDVVRGTEMDFYVLLSFYATQVNQMF